MVAESTTPVGKAVTGEGCIVASSMLTTGIGDAFITELAFPSINTTEIR